MRPVRERRSRMRAVRVWPVSRRHMEKEVRIRIMLHINISDPKRKLPNPLSLDRPGSKNMAERYPMSISTARAI